MYGRAYSARERCVRAPNLRTHAGDSTALAGRVFQVPGVYSLSGRIIHGWLNGRTASDGATSWGFSSDTGSRVSGTEAAMGGAASEGADAGMGSGVDGAGGQGAAAGKPAALAAIPDVQLGEGRFKYVLLRVTDSTGASKVSRLCSSDCQCPRNQGRLLIPVGTKGTVLGAAEPGVTVLRSIQEGDVPSSHTYVPS